VSSFLFFVHLFFPLCEQPDSVLDGINRIPHESQNHEQADHDDRNDIIPLNHGGTEGSREPLLVDEGVCKGPKEPIVLVYGC